MPSEATGRRYRAVPYTRGVADVITRYRCAHCGNKTRFDVIEVVRRRRFHHYSLGGELSVDEEETLERSVESVTCRWCDRADGIEELSPAETG